MDNVDKQNGRREHYKDLFLVYGLVFILSGLLLLLFSLLRIPNLQDYQDIIIGVIFLSIFISFFLIVIAQKNNRNRKRWRFLLSYSEEEQTAILKLFNIARIKGLWALPDLDEEIKRHFLESKKVKIKVTRGYNLFFNDEDSKRDIFYHCIFDAGSKDKREIELLLHLPCLHSLHTRQRAEANHMDVAEYVEKLFEVVKKLKDVTLSTENKNEITVKFYNDYEVKWRYYIFEEKSNYKKTLYLNYYDDRISGAESAMLKIEYGEGSLCHDFDKKFDDIFSNKTIELVSNIKGDISLLPKTFCHPECGDLIKAKYEDVFKVKQR
ncbi:MAG: hypothetical protein JSU01_02720 [Bacteroidetes bacterium]|nr:hypothetical protein [Bacteroidota bacterium]